MPSALPPKMSPLPPIGHESNNESCVTFEFYDKRITVAIVGYRTHPSTVILSYRNPSVTVNYRIITANQKVSFQNVQIPAAARSNDLPAISALDRFELNESIKSINIVMLLHIKKIKKSINSFKLLFQKRLN